uniref:Uncharacterized protein n=1 Tax=Siphoviridae sp. ctdd214 TaxID=2825581 RepID=A0A8S5V6A5_9CAUD|nr:MAG TPA: hypothetical protein [Siphoviridae sp. ctdd214]
MTTYELTKSVISRTIKKGGCTEEYCTEMKEKLDVFLLNERINTEEYEELTKLMETA